MMASDQVIETLKALARRSQAWLDGGWGVDALLAEQTRPHRDLDLVVALPDLPRAQAALGTLGLEHAPEIEPELRARVALRAADDRRVDLHPVLFDAAGNG